jgi:Methylase involved in ubiquinone/menaquinone biosynthesis
VLGFIATDFSGLLLDVPCGTMNLTTVKYTELKNATITCLDYSQDMLAMA